METAASPRFQLIDGTLPADTFAADVRQGLTASLKSIPPRYFYDRLGSILFDAICELPEYYPTRCETEIFHSSAAEIVRSFPVGARIVELGSGSAKKTSYLFDALHAEQSEVHYLPVDIDESVLQKSAHSLLERYPAMRISAICSDFRRPSRCIPPPASHESLVLLFLGSSIGNLDPRESVALLRDLRSIMRPGDVFLLGADLQKPHDILERAYNDAIGVTAAFNLNLLQRINRELHASFDIQAFTHRSFYNESLQRIEMHLVSSRKQSVALEALDLIINFEEGETLHTENSHKYDQPSLLRLAELSGFHIARQWTDSLGWFADLLFVAD